MAAIRLHGGYQLFFKRAQELVKNSSLRIGTTIMFVAMFKLPDHGVVGPMHGLLWRSMWKFSLDMQSLLTSNSESSSKASNNTSKLHKLPPCQILLLLSYFVVVPKQSKWYNKGIGFKPTRDQMKGLFHLKPTQLYDGLKMITTLMHHSQTMITPQRHQGFFFCG